MNTFDDALNEVRKSLSELDEALGFTAFFRFILDWAIESPLNQTVFSLVVGFIGALIIVGFAAQLVGSCPEFICPVP